MGQDTIRIGIIGTGSRGINNIGRQVAEQSAALNLSIAALCDNSEHRLQIGADEINAAAVAAGNAPFTPTLYADALDLINDDNVNLIAITTPTSAHRDAAVPALESGKKVYLDKPMAHTVADALAIRETELRTRNPMIMGFTRRYERPWLELYAMLMRGVIGELKMMLIRAVLPYSRYFHMWHRNRAISGGALNDKGSHYADVFNWFARGRATQVNAFGGRHVFTPRDDAPEYCAVCDDWACPYRAVSAESTSKDDLRGAIDETFYQSDDPRQRKDQCVYKPGADIFDHASVHYQYNNDIVATVFYNVYGPRADDEETFELVGTRGRMILTRLRGEIDLVTDYGERRHEIIECKAEAFETSHFGADRKLIQDIAAFARGCGTPVDGSQGLEATRMILAALQSIDEDGRTIRMVDVADVSGQA